MVGEDLTLDPEVWKKFSRRYWRMVSFSGVIESRSAVITVSFTFWFVSEAQSSGWSLTWRFSDDGVS